MSLRAISDESAGSVTRSATSKPSAMRSTNRSSRFSATERSGWSATSSGSAGATCRRPSAIEQDTRKRPRTSSRERPANSAMLSRTCSIWAACRSTSSPISVRLSLRVVRCRRRTPSSASSRAICRLTKDLLSPTCAAAPLMLRARETVVNSRRSRGSTALAGVRWAIGAIVPRLRGAWGSARSCATGPRCAA
jgi:hypothetical protein